MIKGFLPLKRRGDEGKERGGTRGKRIGKGRRARRSEGTGGILL